MKLIAILLLKLDIYTVYSSLKYIDFNTIMTEYLRLISTNGNI